MKGLLKEKSEIEKFKKEYQKFSENNFKQNIPTPVAKEIVLEECEL